MFQLSRLLVKILVGTTNCVRCQRQILDYIRDIAKFLESTVAIISSRSAFM